VNNAGARRELVGRMKSRCDHIERAKREGWGGEPYLAGQADGLAHDVREFLHLYEQDHADGNLSGEDFVRAALHRLSDAVLASPNAAPDLVTLAQRVRDRYCTPRRTP